MEEAMHLLFLLSVFIRGHRAVRRRGAVKTADAIGGFVRKASPVPVPAPRISAILWRITGVPPCP